MNKKYVCRGEVWKYNGPAGWYFVTLPATITKTFKKTIASWGRVDVHASIGTSAWSTSIWFDGKQQAFLLPIKASIRKKEGIEHGSIIKVTLSLR
jgi:hypothetical protein